MTRSKVFVHKGPDRDEATSSLLRAADLRDLKGKKVLIKPNFNTADPAPGSTHNDGLVSTLYHLNGIGIESVVVGDRSGPSNTKEVFEEKGIFSLAHRIPFEPIVFDELSHERYVKVVPNEGHWRNGFLFVKVAGEVDAVIGLCCLKTHAYGGHFSMGLKLATGMVHRHNMSELHSSLHMREMIAEINLAYSPRLVVMDGVEAFFNGGPMTGGRWQANVSMASSDRVALDAVGVSLLKMHGTTKEIEKRKVFEQDQIRRAVELDLGVHGPEDIEIIPVNDEAESIIEEIVSVLHNR